ncbi:hypothetical protein SEUCBS140593_004540 [Sporothrix eucalyptigena]|uniref:Xylanolytic transcriptional activator regulatory domain-containing protein n=1 Tax=Sporothrix eucalyptigena TaxID=1812306 RepID=A0ABP0BNV9_9PEZI
MLSDFSLPFADLNSPAFDVGVICDMFEIDIAGYWGAQVTTDTAQPMSQANIRFRGDPSARSEAFKRSPWVHWQPAKLHHAFTGQETIDATPTDAAESPLSAQSVLSCTIHDALDERGRDQILQVVTSLKDDRFSVLSFPSLELLNNLVTAFFAQENATIATSIHQPTFSCQDTRPELLLGMIAAGAVAVSERRIQMMGLVMHEVLRLAITELFEYDNSATRDLQALQAFVSVLEIGAWSGVKRKTEIACGFIQPTATMLRQSGAFSQSFFDEPVLTPERRAEDLERRWKKWAAKESLKRLVIRAFVYDSQVAMGYFQSPVISFAQLRIPVPAPAAWWLAEDSVRWSERVPASADNVGASPLITDVLTDLTTLDKYSDQADIQLCCFVVVHALANQVGELRQHMMLAATATGPKQRGLDAWWISRQRELYEDLTIARMYCARRAPHHELGLLFEYVMMSLYVSLDDIQRYAGKDGEGEARRLTPTLTEWSQTAAARTAIWHAGQVFRIARCFPPSTLRNFYAIGVYHAALTLWVYSSLRNGGRTSDVFTPPVAPFAAFDTSASHSRNSINGASRSNDSPLILPAVKLDQEENEDVRAFLLLGLGTPGLCYFVQEGKFTWPGSSQAHGSPSLPQFRSLNSSAFPMELARDIFRNNALFADESSSFLVQNLFGLLGDLESLS